MQAGRWLAIDRGACEAQAVVVEEVAIPVEFPLAERLPVTVLAGLFRFRAMLPAFRQNESLPVSDQQACLVEVNS